ncbi:MAG: TAXI family TRAP transporter solute-binding subunit [Gammaproteobacteria bacterium]|nr:TAXI family TRAP transporter solute-binding subunit [Gammaproteobacteria bacterium]MDH3448253.1 TAXI family TRAP transporter solute-binding subunit [Gammaproteobacteria bacterium]
MRFLLTICALMVVLGSSQSAADEDDLRFFRIGTGGVAGTYFPIGGIIAQAVSNPPGARLCDQGGSCGPPGLVVVAQAANGSVANVRDIQNGNLESAFVQSDVAHWAYTGTGTFRGNPPMRQLRTIANLYPESIHIVARADAGIGTVRDLVGKRVSLDEPGSGTLIDAELVLREYGISIDDIQVEYMKADLAIKWMRSNRLDAFFVVAGYPTQAVYDLATETRIRILPIDGPEAERLVTRHQFLSRDDIPDGIYAGVPRVETLSVGAQWLVAATLDDETVYGITKTLWSPNSRLLLNSGHARGKSITLETALQGIAVPLHPGARRFYNEINLAAE